MAFPSVIVECAFNAIMGDNAQSGFTEITKYVDAVSGTLRGRTYELDQIETGSISVTLDNADGRFTPGSAGSPYFPYVKANRRFRIRGKNLQAANIARAGGREDSTEGFFLNDSFVKDGVTSVVSLPALVSHNAVALGFAGALLAEDTHIEGTLSTGAHAGTYRVLSWWAPVELGVRSTHSAYVWKVSGTEPATTTVAVVNTYYDALGVEITLAAGASRVSWANPTAATPTQRAFSDLPPGNAAYMIQTVTVTLTATATTPLIYAVAGIQSEIPVGNLVPSISGYFDVPAWELAGGGTVATGGTDAATAFVLTTWATDSVELSTTVPHLVPGESYTFVAEVKKSSGPDILLSGDDGLTGTTLSTNAVWTTMRTTFTAGRAEQPIKFIPQAATAITDTLSVRLARCALADAALPLAASSIDTDVTAWARPIPLFDGWVERWPMKTTASASTMTITVDDRLKKLGELVMESTLKQTVMLDAPALLIPFTDNVLDSHGAVSILGDWSDASVLSQLNPSTTKFGAGAGTFTLSGLIGPTAEDAVKLTPAASTTGYVLAIPYTYDYASAPVVPPSTPKPVPKPPVVTTYKRTYYATWSRSYNGANGTRFDDPDTMYQGSVGDSNGNQKSLVGFNWAAISADLKGASVTGMTISLYALYWWSYSSGTGYAGTHTYTSKPSTYSSGSVLERRWRVAGWPRNAWRTINVGSGTGVQFQKGQAKGVSVGWGNNDNETYGWFAGARMSQRPFITITYKK
jgi:hypothetical protein